MRDPIGTGCTTVNHHNQASQRILLCCSQRRNTGLWCQLKRYYPMRDPVGTGCTTDNHHNQASQDNMPHSATEHRAVVPT